MSNKFAFTKTGCDVITSAYNDKLYKTYISDIAHLKPLGREEEKELFCRVKNGDKLAIDKLYKHNLLFVVSVARSYGNIIKGSTMTLEDMIAEGNLGLYSAIERFDHTTDNKFISYAGFWIKQRITKYIYDNSKNIRVPINKSSLLKKYSKIESQLEQKFQRKIEQTEILEEMFNLGIINDANDVDIIEMYNKSRYEVSLETSLGFNGDEHEDYTILGMYKNNDSLNPEEFVSSKSDGKLLNKLLTTLPKNVQEYFIDYYGLNGEDKLTCAEIAKKYDRIPQTVQKIMKNYLKVLQKEAKKIITNETSLNKEGRSVVFSNLNMRKDPIKRSSIYTEQNTIYLI